MVFHSLLSKYSDFRAFVHGPLARCLSACGKWLARNGLGR